MNKNNVVDISHIKPKEDRSLYKRIPIKIVFDPATHIWRWTITITTKTEYSETSDTLLKARKAAQKYIDKNGLSE